MAYFWLLPHIALIVGFLLAAIVVAHMVRQRYSPAGTMAWLLVIVLLPYLGVPLYLMFGGRKLQKVANSKADITLTLKNILPEKKATAMDRLLRTYGIPGATRTNALTLCWTGEDSYKTLVKLIAEARQSISITTFIFSRDELGREILARLAKRAAEGLEVRLLLDGVGSMYITRRFLAPLFKAGGQAAFFFPVLHWPFRGRANLRNHRKLIVLDNRRVMAGGINISGEYIGSAPKRARWKDLAFVLEGPAVAQYTELFRSDWEFATSESANIIPPAATRQKSFLYSHQAVVQVVPSGPDVPGDPLYGAILSGVFAAQKRFWIVTPYFIPDDALLQALCLAAQRGVDVRVIVPKVSNHPVADMARGIYLRKVQAAGGKILLYHGGMLHAKVILLDQAWAMMGSANFDFRSLFLNYEAAIFVYNLQMIQEVEAWVKHLALQTKQGVADKMTVFRDICEGLVHMLAPLL